MIFFVSDFGHADGFVGVVEAKIAARAPDVRVVHLAHDVPPQDLRAGSLVAWSSAPELPAGSVLLGVVDPGVGSARRPIAARAERLFYVGPDNGLFGAAWLRDPVREACVLRRDPALGARTFDGRDLFGPAAAQLAMGAPLAALGEPISPASLAPPIVRPTRAAEGEIWSFDRFGNAVTSLDSDFGSTGTLEVGTHRLPIATHFADVAPGAPVAYVGSSGLVEIAVRDGNARRVLSLEAGARVVRA